MKDDRLLELAISGLEAQRDRIEDELAQLRGRLKGAKPVRSASSRANAAAKKKGRTAAQKKAHSERMKKIWADRKKASK